MRIKGGAFLGFINKERVSINQSVSVIIPRGSLDPSGQSVFSFGLVYSIHNSIEVAIKKLTQVSS